MLTEKQAKKPLLYAILACWLFYLFLTLEVFKTILTFQVGEY